MPNEKTFYPSTPSDKIKLQKPVHKLGFKCIISAGSPLAAFDVLQGVTITVTRNSANLGQKNLTPVKPPTLADVLEIFAIGRGFVYIFNHTTSGQYVIEGSMDLAATGAIDLTGTDYIEVAMAGMDAAGIVSIALSAVSHAARVNEHQKLSARLCTANTATRIDVASKGTLYVPIDCLNLSFFYEGKNMSPRVDLDTEDLKLIAVDNDEIVFLVNGTAVPFRNWRGFDVAECKSVEVLLPAEKTAYLVGEKDYDTQG